MRLVNSDFIETLQRELVEQRNDYRFTLAQKDAEIRRLRAELASVTMEPEPVNAKPAGMVFPVTPPTITSMDWATELNKMLSEEEDGIRSERREEVHQSAPDESA
jgi:hypothetical protein